MNPLGFWWDLWKRRNETPEVRDVENAMDLVKFVLGTRFVSDWLGLHRRDVSVVLALVNAGISVLVNQDVISAFPHLAGLQATLLGLSSWIGAAGILDKSYANPAQAAAK